MNNRELLNKIENNEEIVGIIGLGYVGLPLAVSFAKKGIKVLGFEKSENKASLVNAAQNYIKDVDSEVLKACVREGKLSTTTDMSRIRECDALIICVPTPLDHFKKPDMSFIESACIDIGRNMKRGVFISLESTTYPTTTEDVVKPIVEHESGFKEGEDFWLCFSPERVDPGNKDYKTENTPKVVGGLGEEAQKIALALYGKAIQKLYPVSSPRVAEMVKILENTYRLVNISLINELALLAGKMDINIWEVIEAAKSKPYGFQAFYPGPGIGGHCIPLDPFYLEYIAKGINFDLTMIDAAGRINNLQPYRMMNKISYALNRQGKPMNGSTILFLGVAYKADIDDARESPALLVMEECAKKRANVLYHDPYIPEVVDEHGKKWTGVALTDELLENADCVVFTTAHSCFDVEHIVERAKLIVDLKNVVRIFGKNSNKIVRL
ncbi:MAG TPA: nucleotide sugar dehydrogenase [Rectinema sp.]|jgi:UDP-N-acetyl-D-glucosamine dehydrogenase|nr:nucleotide sugar dehydrogenase [Spirochaetia bacterium]HNV36076.1 nucleotide sugar dehydrogenase [Rectinema sp.]HPG96615.1 nucleotide sugar dehydrogenase [Rectinema sp.]HPN03213.1 nucleotide sugar dehydrogenase [Rectinema sp.]